MPYKLFDLWASRYHFLKMAISFAKILYPPVCTQRHVKWLKKF